MKKFLKFLTSGIVILVLTGQGFAGTVTGQVQNPQGGAVANATYTFNLTQSATISGTAALVTGPVSCYTDANGNVVNEPNPLVNAVVSQNLGAGSLGAGTYYVRLSYRDTTGETVASPEVAFTLTGAGTLIVNAPVKQPANVTSYRVYIGSTSGSETLQGSVTVTPGSWGNYSQSSALVAGAALPVLNTTVCTIHFNDEMQPSFVCYDVGLTGQTGTTLPGYPQFWYLVGGSAGTVNISTGTPQANVCQGQGWFFPQVIYSQPPSNGSQSISGPLSVQGGLNSPIVNGTCIVAVPVGGAMKYANIAAAVADATCHNIHIPDGYNETETGNLALKGSMALTCDGICTINLNGTNQITLTGGGTAADNLTIGGNFPLSDHGNGNNSGFQITGYTGTGAAVLIGNSTSGATRTQQFNLSNVSISLLNAGSGAVGVELLNTQESNIYGVNCPLGNTNQGCILLDGTGNFSGIVSITNSGATGSANGQFWVRAQNTSTQVSVINGSANLTGTTGTICWDVEGGTGPSDVALFYPNCNSASTAIQTGGAGSRITGTMRRDTGVTKVATWGTGTASSYVLCNECLFAPNGGNTVTNNSTLNNYVTDGNFGFSADFWKWDCAGGQNLAQTAGDCVLYDVKNANFVFGVVPGANDELDLLPTSGALGSGYRFTVNGVTIPANKNAQLLEGADPGCSGTGDAFHADSVAQRMQLCNHGGASFNVVTSSSTDNLTNKTLNIPLSSGTGLQVFNTSTTCTTGASVGATCTTAAISLPVAEADTSYRVTCTGKGLTNVPVVIATANSSGSQFTITIAALTAAAASFSSYDCVAGHN